MENLPVPYNPRPSGADGNKNAGSGIAKKRRGPAFCNVLLFNTERVPADDCSMLLSRVFGREAQAARFSSWFERHITMGPYSREVAETKMRQVRQVAHECNLIAPVMHRRPV